MAIPVPAGGSASQRPAPALTASCPAFTRRAAAPTGSFRSTAPLTSMTPRVTSPATGVPWKASSAASRATSTPGRISATITWTWRPRTARRRRRPRRPAGERQRRSWLRSALGHYQTAVGVADLTLPDPYGGFLTWGHLDNRPFFRALHVFDRPVDPGPPAGEDRDVVTGGGELLHGGPPHPAGAARHHRDLAPCLRCHRYLIFLVRTAPAGRCPARARSAWGLSWPAGRRVTRDEDPGEPVRPLLA